MIEQYKKRLQLFFAGKQKTVSGDLYVKPLGKKKLRKTAFLFCIHDKKGLESVRKLMAQCKAEKEEVRAFVFYDEFHAPDVITDHGMLFFNLNDFNWLGKARDELIRKLQRDAFEYLIAFNVEPWSICRQLVAAFDAGLKIAPAHPDSDQAFHFTLKWSFKKPDFPAFYTQVKHYLDALHIKNDRPQPVVPQPQVAVAGEGGG